MYNVAKILILIVCVVSCTRTQSTEKSNPEKPAIAPPANLLIVVIDTLRRDHLGHYGYDRPTTPFWDSLTSTSVVFDRAYSAAAWTKPSVGSILTGLYPNKHGAIRKQHRLRVETVTIAEHLQKNGFRTIYVNGGNDHIGDIQRFHHGFDEFRILEKRSGNLGDAIVNQFLKLLDGKKQERFFGYVHLMDVHSPYFKTEFTDQFVDAANAATSAIKSSRRINPPLMRGLKKEGRLGPAEKKTVTDHYDASIRFADAQLQRLFDGLKKRGFADNTYYVIVADHGEELWDHGAWYHGHSLYNELIHIPLTIGGPGLSGTRLNDLVSHVDIAPTVYDLLKIDRKSLNLDGKSIFQELGWQETARDLYASAMLQGPEQSALISEQEKAMWIPDTAAYVGQGDDAELSGVSAERLYDLIQDPKEQNDISKDRPKSMTAAIEKLRHYYQQTVTVDEFSESELDPAVMRRLKALGYAQ